MNLVLDTDYNTFLMNINGFKLGILRKLGGRFVGRLRLITILSIIFSSVDVSTSVTLPEGEDADETFNSLN